MDKKSVKKASTKKTTKTKKKKVTRKSGPTKKKLKADADKAIVLLNDVENDMKLSAISIKGEQSVVRGALSTGSLALDLSLGGGWAPGRVCSPTGPEQAGKTTLLLHTLREALQHGIPSVYYDMEASIDRMYMEQIGINWDRYFTRNKLFRPYWPEVGEDVFRHMMKVLKGLPSRDSGPVQVVFFIDSAAAMVPKAEMDEDKSAGLLKRPQMFSAFLPKLSTLIASKRCLLIMTNQLRTKPGTAYGNPEYNPGGEALKHYTSQRLNMRKFSKQIPKSKKVMGMGVGGIEQEKHVSGVGYDRYVYTKISVVKNKAFPPWKSAELRIWVQEQGGLARGIDPVWDVFQFLTMTGQVEPVGRRYEVALQGFEGKYTWEKFKCLVLEPGVVETVGGLNVYNPKQDDIKQACRAQINSGEAFDLYRAVEYEGVEPTKHVEAKIIGPAMQQDSDGEDVIVGLLVETDDGSQFTLDDQNLTKSKVDTLTGHIVKMPV